MRHHPLSSFPWATLGRPESGVEFFKKCEGQKGRFTLLPQVPLISIVVSVSEKISLSDLDRTLWALSLQSYPRFEAIILMEGNSALLQDKVQEFHDGRFSCLYVDSGLLPGTKKKLGAEKANGEWIGFIEASDVLSPVALYEMLLPLQAGAELGLLYCNEAEFHEKGISQFFSKPEFSWFNLIHFNYIGGFWMVRRALFEECGGFSADESGTHEHTFLLRLSEKARSWHLVPMYLLYRSSPPPLQPSVSMVEQHLGRLGLKAKVHLAEGRLKIIPEIKEPISQLVSVIVCFKNRADWTVKCLEKLALQGGRIKMEVILVNNASAPEELKKVEAGAAKFPHSIQIIHYDGAFNFGHMHNLAIRKYARGNFIVFLNNDVFWNGADALEQMLAWAQMDWIGTVGVLLRYGHGGIQHSGFQARFGGTARLARLGNSSGRDAFALEAREVFGNTFAACLTKRSTFDLLGGLREIDLPNGFGDVAFNFDCLRRGLKNIYLGYLSGTHLESASRGLSDEYWEECIIEREYPDILQRMLRCDLGYDRVPSQDFEIPHYLLEAFKAELRRKAPWLKPFKDYLRKIRNTRLEPTP